MSNALELNKTVVKRFNKEVIEAGNYESFDALMHKDFVNRTAPAGADNGPASMKNTFENILRPAFSGLAVTIFEQVAEGELVTTRKAITGKHTGTFLGIAPTQQDIRIDVIDIVRVRDGQYFEHWGMNSIQALMAKLSKA